MPRRPAPRAQIRPRRSCHPQPETDRRFHRDGDQKPGRPPRAATEPEADQRLSDMCSDRRIEGSIGRRDLPGHGRPACRPRRPDRRPGVDRSRARSRCPRRGHHPRPAVATGLRGARRGIRQRRPVPQPRRHGRHGFGRGEYRYFTYPLPQRGRGAARGALSAARRDRQSLERRSWAIDAALPGRARRASWPAATRPARRRPTPLLLRYGPGDYNCLHQDLYGEHVFPLQVAILLSEPGRDFTGGEFVLTEQRPRMQSRVEVVPLPRATP